MGTVCAFDYYSYRCTYEVSFIMILILSFGIEKKEEEEDEDRSMNVIVTIIQSFYTCISSSQRHIDRLVCVLDSLLFMAVNT